MIKHTTLQRLQSVRPPTIVWLLLCLLIATSLRTVHPQLYPFGFDQLQLVQNAERITQGDVTLIGPRTGPAPLFTGPLIYYVTALWWLIAPNIWSLVLTSVSLAMVTGIALWWLTKRFVDPALQWPIMGLWALSPLLIQFDRVPWNPNLTLLASALVFFPSLHWIHTNQITRYHLLAVGLGGFLGFQAHFSTLFLPLIVLLALAIRLAQRRLRLRDLSILLAVSFGLATSLIPAAVFDLRNNWLHVRGVLSLLEPDVTRLGVTHHWRLYETLRVNIETLGKIVFATESYGLVMMTGIAALGVVIWQTATQKKNRVDVLFSLSWLIVISVIFSFYRGSKPEYYYFIGLPAGMWLWAHVIGRAHKNSPAYYWLLLVWAVGTALTLIPKKIHSNMNIGDQLRAHSHVQDIMQEQPVQRVVFDIEPVERLGLEYLFERQPLSLSENGATVHIMTEHINREFETRPAGNLQVWIDPRLPSKEHSYLPVEDIILRYPKTWELVSQIEPSPMEALNFVDRFRVLKQGQTTPYFIWVVPQYGPTEALVQELNVARATANQPLPQWTEVAIGDTYSGLVFRHPQINKYIIVATDTLEPRAQTGLIEFTNQLVVY